MAHPNAGTLPTITADFNGTPVTIIERDGHRWLTAQEIGLALGYNPGNARTGITNLYGRHKDEFSGADTCAIKLMAQGQMRETRLFSATGCIKLGFFASTPKAKEFRTWSSEVLAEQTDPTTPVLAPEMWAQLSALYEQLGQRDSQIIGLLQVQQQAMTALNLDLRGQVTKLTTQVERLSGKVITTQVKLIKSQSHNLALVKCLGSDNPAEGERLKDTIIRMERQGCTRATIVAATGRTYNHVRQVVHKARVAGELPPTAPAKTQPEQTSLDLQGA